MELLGVIELPTGTQFAGSEIGGLSGITYDAARDRYYTISDDRSDHAPARFYTVSLALDGDRFVRDDLQILSVTPLTDESGATYRKGSIDAEAIALAADGNSLWISSEGDVRAGIAPFVHRYALDGTFLQALSVPAHFLPRENPRRGYPRQSRIRERRREHGRCHPDGRHRKRAVSGRSRSFGRFAKPVATPDVRPGPFGSRGRDDDRGATRAPPSGGWWLFRQRPGGARCHEPRTRCSRWSVPSRLALATPSVSHRCRLAGATDVASLPTLTEAATPIEPVACELLVNLAVFGHAVDNVEGMTFGPRLDDGRQTLVLVSDNNFRAQQVTQLWVLAADSSWFLGDAPSRDVRAPTISEIQGAGHRSPLEGTTVAGVAGVVTAVMPGEGRTVWIQSVAPLSAKRLEASSALRVDTSAVTTPVAPGQLVRVNGTVVERERPRQLSVTTIEASSIEVVGNAEAPPVPVVLGAGGRAIPEGWIDDDGLTTWDPEHDAIDFFESLEGMLVELPDPVVVGPTSRYGDLAVVVSGGDQHTTSRTRSGALLETPSDTNPERIVVDDTLLGAVPTLAVGSRLGPVTGVLDYSWGRYAVLASEPLEVLTAAPIPTETTTLVRDGSRWTLATFNIENLSAVSSHEKVNAIAETIVSRLQAPDVVTLQEIQDNSGPEDDGVVAADSTLDRLIDAVVAAGGPRYTAFQLDPVDNADGGQPGGNIRVGILIDEDRVGLAEHATRAAGSEPRIEAGPRLLPNPARITTPEARLQATAASRSWPSSTWPDNPSSWWLCTSLPAAATTRPLAPASPRSTMPVSSVPLRPRPWPPWCATSCTARRRRPCGGARRHERHERHCTARDAARRPARRSHRHCTDQRTVHPHFQRERHTDRPHPHQPGHAERSGGGRGPRSFGRPGQPPGE